MRSLAGMGGVSFSYDLPLKDDGRFGEAYADPEVVAAVACYVHNAKKSIAERFSDSVKIHAQLDPNTGFDGLDRQVVTGYSFSINIRGVDGKDIGLGELEEAVFGFIDMVPLKPTVGGGPKAIFDKIRTCEF